MKKRMSVALLFALCLALLSCGKEGGKYQPGTYQGEGVGYSKEEPIVLTVTIDGSGAIYEVKILKSGENPEIGNKALTQLAEEAVQKGTDKVDTISGATRTTEGFRHAMADALEKARGDR